jgi:hypothetical protein
MNRTRAGRRFIALSGGYFTIRGRFVSGIFFSSAGEKANVTHAVQPSGRFSAAKSL